MGKFENLQCLPQTLTLLKEGVCLAKKRGRGEIVYLCQAVVVNWEKEIGCETSMKRPLKSQTRAFAVLSVPVLRTARMFSVQGTKF